MLQVPHKRFGAIVLIGKYMNAVTTESEVERIQLGSRSVCHGIGDWNQASAKAVVNLLGDAGVTSA